MIEMHFKDDTCERCHCHRRDSFSFYFDCIGIRCVPKKYFRIIDVMITISMSC